MGNFFASKRSETARTSQQNQYDPTGLSLYQRGATNYRDFLDQMAALTGVRGTSPLLNALQQALQLSPGEQALAGAYRSAYSNLPSLQAGVQNTLNTVATPLSTDAVLNPLIRAFQQTIVPAINSQAVQMGAAGGTRQAELLNRALGEFGSQASDALGRLELNRRQQEILGSTYLPSVYAQLATTQTQPAQTEAQQGALSRALQLQSVLAPLSLLQNYQNLQPITPLQTGLTSESSSTVRTAPSPYSALTGTISDMMQLGLMGMFMAGAGPFAPLGAAAKPAASPALTTALSSTWI